MVVSVHSFILIDILFVARNLVEGFVALTLFIVVYDARRFFCSRASHPIQKWEGLTIA